MDTVLERNIYELLTLCLSGDETLAPDLRFDLFAPKGIRNLEWPENTVVEFKRRIIYDTMDKIRAMYDSSEIHIGSLVVVAYEKPQIHQYDKYRGLHGRNITLLSYSELLERIAQVADIHESQGKKKEIISVNDNRNVMDKARNALKNDKISLFFRGWCECFSRCCRLG